MPPWSYSAPRGWKQLRQAILRRDKHTCYLCGEPATEVDHKQPMAEGGTHHPTNLAAICTTCHATKTKHEATRGKQRHAALRNRPKAPHPGTPPHLRNSG